MQRVYRTRRNDRGARRGAEVSTTITFHIAKLLEISLHEVIQGIALPKPTCPHCGKAI